MDRIEAWNRWKRPEWHAIEGRVAGAIVRGKINAQGLERLAPKTETGLFDLRGFPVSDHQELLRLKRARIRDVDLSFALFGRVLMQDCEFDNVNLTGMQHAVWNERDCRFRNVQLRDVKFSNGAIGLEGSLYEHIDFSGCIFADAHFYRPTFRDCTFASPMFRSLDFYMSNFAGCTFSGQLHSVWFRGGYPFPSDQATFGPAAPNEMKVDFSDASLWDAVFTNGVDLSNVILPRDGCHALFRHFQKDLLRCIERAGAVDQDSIDGAGAASLIRGYLTHAKHQEMWILNRRDLEEELGKETGDWLFNSLLEFDSEQQ